MKETIFFSLPGNKKETKKLADAMHIPIGKSHIRTFPDGETFIRILSEVKQKNVVLVSTLHRPNGKLLPLYFFSQLLKTLGANRVFLVAPYLAYMRQDSSFHSGEGITAQYFGALVSSFVDGLVTVDPHLHRIESLSSICPTQVIVVHAADAISNWIVQQVKHPLVIGPDKESKQWVSVVAQKAQAPFVVLRKIRRSATDVKIDIPKLDAYNGYTPVLVDDIISTGHTMIETVQHLKEKGMKPAICIGIHAVFAGNSYKALLDSGIEQVVTCDTIRHPSNGITLTGLLSEGLTRLLTGLV